MTSLRELFQVWLRGTQRTAGTRTCACEEQLVNLPSSSGLTADVTVNLPQHIGLPSLKSSFIILLRLKPSWTSNISCITESKYGRGLLINITGGPSASLTRSDKYGRHRYGVYRGDSICCHIPIMWNLFHLLCFCYFSRT